MTPSELLLAGGAGGAVAVLTCWWCSWSMRSHYLPIATDGDAWHQVPVEGLETILYSDQEIWCSWNGLVWIMVGDGG